MGKIHLFLLDDDQAYADRLYAFIRSSSFMESLSVKLFTKQDYVQELLECKDQQGIYAVSETFYTLFDDQVGSGLCRIVLSGSISNLNDLEAGVHFLYRYQPLDQLLNQMIALYNETNEASLPMKPGHAQVVSVFSSVGNSGKTITSIHLAKQLAFRGSKVFYLSLETLSFADGWFQGDPSRFSQLLYYAKSSPAFLEPKLDLLKSHDAGLGFDYLTPGGSMREMQEMTGDDTKAVLEAIIGLGRYDYIVIDLEAAVHPRIMKAMELSDHVLWLVLDDVNCLFKTQAYRKLTGPLKQVYYVNNKFTGAAVNDFAASGLTISGNLPYIPEWKTVHEPGQFMASPVFSEQVFALATETVLRGRKGAVS